VTVLVTSVSIVLTSCERAKTEAKTAPAAGEADKPVRLVSLSPAISRTLVDLGLAGELVGRSAYCESVDGAIPVVGDLFDVDFERLVRLRPTDLLVQPPGDGVEEALTTLAEEQGFEIHTWRINTVADVRAMVGDLGGRFAGASEGVAAAADRLDARLAAIDDPEEGAVRTLLVQSLDPLLVAGTSTYLDELLRSAGGVNAVSRTGWAELSLEDAARLNPSVIVVLRGTPEPDAGWRSTVLSAIDCDATRDERVVFIASSDALLPSSAIANLAEPMRRAVLGEASAE
jgi:ABC-type hemin transport system substrate-binding protein